MHLITFESIGDYLFWFKYSKKHG